MDDKKMFLNRKIKMEFKKLNKPKKKLLLLKLNKYSKFLLQSSNALHHTHNILSSTKNKTMEHFIGLKKKKNGK